MNSTGKYSQTVGKHFSVIAVVIWKPGLKGILNNTRQEPRGNMPKYIHWMHFQSRVHQHPLPPTPFPSPLIRILQQIITCTCLNSFIQVIKMYKRKLFSKTFSHGTYVYLFLLQLLKPLHLEVERLNLQYSIVPSWG